MYQFLPLSHQSALKIQLSVADLDRLVIVLQGTGAADSGIQTRDQFAKTKRLGNIIVRSSVKSEHFVFFVVLRRKDDDWQPRCPTSNHAAHVNSPDSWQIDFKQNRIEIDSACELNCLFAATGANH